MSGQGFEIETVVGVFGLKNCYKNFGRRCQFNDLIIPDALKDGHVEDAETSFDDTESDDSDPDAERIKISINKRDETASIPSRCLKMVARRKMMKTRGPPPESSSMGK
ncbi:hypothetical protein L1987_33078 [Smallanthus sonchifolius]|uniref:Uncharacterized protein n=1 Tax=Smallanthus sonchifolius TaxID=185202 RepID=A0ACB9HRC9_9ASTR|nr:hypothetical protein L1987_33078 [Smallanthus sonchifolius]